ncbi:MAG TPA: DNA-directed RNA polymerase subunit beta' [Patescibacteria group bacterium]|jgi:DNA-directed RNA polymerase subunit beta'|nr:DNA-directed RNA polymerase subunit beta' [Patescibacteria group bacterium]
MARFTPTTSIADFDAVRLAVASSDDILKWSHGEVTKPETINYRTQKPERDGLFCERIFGPVKDINPHDSKLKGVRSREAAVDKNGELVTKSIVRRERMGHIQLAAPVAHIWFMRGTPSAMSLLLGITVRNLERIAYFATYVILDVDTAKRDQMLADLEAETEAGRAAIKIRYEREASADDADVKKLAAEQTKELEELEANFALKKAQLEGLVLHALLNETDYRNLPEEYQDLLKVGMGGTALKRMLDDIDLETLIAQLSEEVETAKGQREKKLLKRLKVLEGMLAAGIMPNSLALTVLPVIPPDLRPMVQLTGGRFATSDLNDLYRRVINRNNRLKKLIELNAPEVIQRNEMRMLQEAVDSLIDNSAARGGRAVNATGGRRRLKSISDMLKGKQGRFRQNLLGKRVDYSGRSVIVVGPKLKISQCGLPKMMALELFKPFIISWLIRNEYAHNIRSATRLIESGEAVVWDALDSVIEGKYVLLNRAPSLHRLSIQAFQPKLVEGKAIQLHPLVANGFNADYDGDQMAVHLPLSKEAQREARELMSATNNLLKPADGAPVLNIGQDVVLGNYYLTYEKPGVFDKDMKVFANSYDAELAYDHGKLQLQTPIRLRTKGEIRTTTLGRVFFNEILPDDFPYDNSVQNKKQLKKVLGRIFDKYGAEVTAQTADRMKGLAFRFATTAAVSTGKDDYPHFEEVSEFVAEGDAKAALISEQFDEGLITEEERYNLTVANWRAVDNKITEFLQSQLADMDTSISVMVNSGARGDISNVKLASAMIGIQVDATNREIELPVRSSFIQGLSSLEAFVATRGSRKGLIDTALKTADSGYLTRRLVDVSQDVFTVADLPDEIEDQGFAIYRAESEHTMINFGNRLYGRYTAEAVNGHIGKDELITREIAEAIEADESITEVKIQSILSANSLRGIPQKSYGIDMATNQLVDVAQPVGVIAAQSVGEPGTQLTLRTFHNSGVAGSDITQGLPRVEELFEARTPKGQAYISEISGIVDVWEDGKNYIVQVTPDSGTVERIKLDGRTVIVKDGSSVKAGDILAEADGKKPLVAPFDGVVEAAEDTLVIAAEAGAPVKNTIPGSAQLVVKAGDVVAAGDQLTVGSLNLHELMRLKGVEATQRYIINDVLRIYAAQGQDVADKHLEIIVRQMFSRVQIEDAGDASFVTGDIVSKAAVIEENSRLAAEGKEPAQYKQLLLGITKVSIWSDSWLSAASFQDTTRVLINAATSGRADHLMGLKENVIIGRKIPVGTGAEGYDSETGQVADIELEDADVTDAIESDIELAA